MNLGQGCPGDPGEGLEGQAQQEARYARARCHICVMRSEGRLPTKGVVGLLFKGAGGGGPEPQAARFCNICCHWFCETCWNAGIARAFGFVEQLVKGSEEGCCGP